MKRRTILVGSAVALLGAFGAVAAMSPPSGGTPTGAVVAKAGAGPGILRAVDAGRGAELFRTCSACHTVGRGGADVDGPNLYGVVDARVAERRPRYGYTQALRDAGGIWTERRLDAWLTDPAAFAPGTAMHFPGLPDAEERGDVIAYLATQGPARK